MIFNKKLAVAVSGAVLLMAGQFALADSTTDIVDALVSKGVLTEEEGKLISKGATSKAKADEKAMKSKINISGAIENATLYGDIRVRHETRWAENHINTVDYTRNRERYKITLGLKTETDKGNWYSDLAFAMGSEGRSDNATFGGSTSPVAVTNGNAPKETLFVKRAMVGFKPAEWLGLEAGRITNPLYTTEMVWDKDLTFDGATAKFNFKAGDAKIFLTGVAFQYKGDSKIFTGTTTADAFTNEVVVGQAGFQVPFNEKIDAKAAISYYKYGNAGGGNFGMNAATAALGSPTGRTAVGTNNLEIVEVPAELSYKATDAIGVKLYGDWVINTDADKRAELAADTTSAKDDDTAWLLGAEVKSQAGKKEAANDWNAKVWYQETGLYALDPNAVDSDFFDSKINVKGTVFKAQYYITDAVFANFAYGHGKRKNADGQTAGVSGDTTFNFNNMDLLQLDLTYKF
jgi:polyhydroxyalkanoate synthesis regulator phasin